MFDLITGLIEGAGVLGVALLMLLENVFPPIPSELIMPLAGYLAAEGRLDLVLVLAAGTAGSVAGALVWYELARLLGEARFLALIDRWGLWATLTRDDAERALDWFRRRGAWAVFLGRMVPAVRTLISVPAGLAGMGRLPFLAWTALGSLIWCSLLTAAGYLLRSGYRAVEHWLDPATTLVIVAVVAIWLFRVARLALQR